MTHTLDISGYADYYDQQYLYPYEWYQVVSAFLALDPATNESYPIHNVAAIDAVQNLIPTSGAWGSSSPPWDPTNSTERLGSETMRLILVRPKFLKAFVLTLFSINWALTAAVVYVTLTALWRREVSESVILLPVSVILTIPGTRALWVGAPPFGE